MGELIRQRGRKICGPGLGLRNLGKRVDFEGEEGGGKGEEHEGGREEDRRDCDGELGGGEWGASGVGVLAEPGAEGVAGGALVGVWAGDWVQEEAEDRHEERRHLEACQILTACLDERDAKQFERQSERRKYDAPTWRREISTIQQAKAWWTVLSAVNFIRRYLPLQ